MDYFLDFIESQNIEKTFVFNFLKCSKEEAEILHILANAWVDDMENNDAKIDTRMWVLLCKVFKCTKKEALRHLHHIENLLELGWIELNTISSRNTNKKNYLLNYFGVNLTLGENFLSIFEHIRKTPKKISKKIQKYENQTEYIHAEFDRVELLIEIALLNFSTKNKSGIIDILKTSHKLMNNEIQARLKNTKEQFEIIKIFKENKLDDKEKIMFLYSLRLTWSSGYENNEVGHILDLISNNEHEKIDNMNYLTTESKLIKNNIFDIYDEPFRDDRILKSCYLNESIIERILQSGKKLQKRDRKITITQVIKEQDMFELITPKNNLDDLILNTETKDRLTYLISQVDKNVVNRLKLWGIKDKKSGIDAKVLFFGFPGTGKTMSALGLAKSLKRSVLSFDCSKILSMYVGESEKNVRKIFDSYEEICQKTKNEPILLLDEADQFLSTRVDFGGSADKMHNQMQNIFLERLEKFDGLLIATTNLLETFDSAFSRRFNYKIKFERPNKEQRELLWLKYFPKNADFEEDKKIMAKELSKYDLSGGQISLVIKNTAYKIATTSNPIFSLKAFKDEIQNEQNSNFDSSKNLGFMT